MCREFSPFCKRGIDQSESPILGRGNEGRTVFCFGNGGITLRSNLQRRHISYIRTDGHTGTPVRQTEQAYGHLNGSPFFRMANGTNIGRFQSRKGPRPDERKMMVLKTGQYLLPVSRRHVSSLPLNPFMCHHFKGHSLLTFYGGSFQLYTLLFYNWLLSHSISP